MVRLKANVGLPLRRNLQYFIGYRADRVLLIARADKDAPIGCKYGQALDLRLCLRHVCEVPQSLHVAEIQRVREYVIQRPGQCEPLLLQLLFENTLLPRHVDDGDGRDRNEDQSRHRHSDDCRNAGAPPD